MELHAANPHPRRLVATALAALAALIAPAAAQAAPGGASVDKHGKLTYSAKPGAANHLLLTATGSTVVLTESGAGASIARGKHCTGGGPSVTCKGVTRLVLNLGDGDDFLDSTGVALPTTVTAGAGADRVSTGSSGDWLGGGDGDDVLAGGAGPDFLDGGAGDDLVTSRDGTLDHVVCGLGADGGSADQADAVAGDCEHVDQSAPESPGDGPAPGEGPAPGSDGGSILTRLINALPPVLPAQTAPVSRKGVARVRVVCPAKAGRCNGTVTLFLLNRPKRARRPGSVTAARVRAGGPRIGRAKFRVKAGRKLFVKVKLNRRGRRRVLRGRRRRCRMVVSTRDAAGRLHTRIRTIRLSVPRHRRQRH